MRGVDILIYVNTGTDVSPTWTVVGGQRGATLSEKADAIETTSKDSGGYREYDYGLLDWTMSCDGVYVNDDEAYEALKTAMRTKQKVQVRLREPAGTTGTTNTEIGYAIVTSRELDAPYDDTVTYSLELQGTGPIASSNTP